MPLQEDLRAPRFRVKRRILICFSSHKKSKQILAYEIEKNDLRKELFLLKNKAYNLRNFSTFAAILKILNPQCIAIVARTPPGRPKLRAANEVLNLLRNTGPYEYKLLFVIKCCRESKCPWLTSAT